ncbi:hypothetical protein J6590_040370, partial [Homalodisca vitripennis]
MACAHLHNFLRRNACTSSRYSPPGTFDSEDEVTGELVPEEWRLLGSPTDTLLKLKTVPKKSCEIA